MMRIESAILVGVVIGGVHSNWLSLDVAWQRNRVLTREALIIAKKAIGRPKDLLTVVQLAIGRELEKD